MKKDLNQAEKKARLREFENEKNRQALTDEEIQKANELQNKATARGMLLVPERKIKNKARFAQIIQENWLYLIQNDILKNEEIMFLNKILGFIGIRSNPNIIFCGDRDNVNETLQTMFRKKSKELKNLPVNLV